MLRRIRVLRAAQLALVVAALLAVGGSFGLHPEPSAARVPAAGGEISTIPDVAAPHGCLACMTHGAALVSPLFGILLAGAPSAPLTTLLDRVGPACRLGRDLPGRSPPAGS